MPSLSETKGTDADGRAWLRRLGAAMAVCALLLGAAITFFHLGFETNDDVAMLKLAAGLYDGHPGEFLVFMNVVLGLFLKFLYEQFAHVPWYEILLLTVHFLALSLLLFVLFLRGFSWRTMLLFLSFYLGCELVVLCRMSYTTTAFMAGMSGVLLVVTAFSTGKPFPGIVFAAVGGCLVVLSGLVRWYSLVLVLLLSVPLILRVDRRLRARVWITIGLASALSLGFFQYNQRLHVEAGWGDYLEYDRYRRMLQDFPRLTINEETRPHFREVGWDEHDVSVFRFFNHDERVFAGANLKRLAEHAVVRPAREVIGIIRDNLSYHKFTLLIAAALVALVLLLTDRKSRWIMILTAGWSVVVFLGLAGAAKPAFRVMHSVIVFSAGVAIFLLCLSGGLRQTLGLRRWTVVALIALLTAGTLLQTYRMMRESERNRGRGRQFDEFATVRSRLEPDAILIPYGGTYPLPLFTDLDKLRSPRALPGGWLIKSPVYETMKRKLGVTEVHEALLHREHCYLVLDQHMDYHMREHLPPFFKRHYGADVSFETVSRDGGCIIYRLVSPAAP